MYTISDHAELNGTADRLFTEGMDYSPLETRYFLGLVQQGRPVNEAARVLHPDCAGDATTLVRQARDCGMCEEDLRRIVMRAGGAA